MNLDGKSNSSKESTSAKHGSSTSGGNGNDQKITSFFPVLRPEGRAKMCASKTGDLKQKEILQKLKSQEPRSLRLKSQDSKSGSQLSFPKTDVASSPQVKEKFQGSIPVSSALKTPLSQVLRRNMEAAESKKEEAAVSQTEENQAASAPLRTSQRARKSFPSADQSRTLRQKVDVPPKSSSPSLKTMIKKTAESNSSNGVKRKVTPEPNDSSSKSTTPIPQTEDSELGNTSAKKRKRRHFRGGTYGLFLTKKSKKKWKSAEGSKDDENSQPGTENSSYMDSDDDNSLMSEGLYTPSEKSLVDDDPNTDSRISPLLASELKDEAADCLASILEEQKESDMHESDLAKEEMQISSDAVKVDESEDKVKDAVNWEDDDTKMGDADEMKQNQSNEEEHRSVSPDAMASEAGAEDTEERASAADVECKEEDHGDQEEENDDENASHADDDNQLDPDYVDDDNDHPDDNDDDNDHPDDNYDDNDHPDDNDDQDGEHISHTSGDEHENEASSVLSSLRRRVRDKDRDSDGSSTIATSVKSRTRIKRRFTDDIVDTEMGLMSLNPPPPAVLRKVPPPKVDPPQDIIQTLKPVTKSEAKKGLLTKIECIFNHHQIPIKSCCCDDETYEANLDNEEEGVFCQAVDSIDDKLVGCSNSVVTTRLVRASVKIPFTVMCEMHLWRLKHHHSCPYCGLFCSQGTFLQCASKKNNRRVVHLFHEQCQSKEEGIEPFCLHCGNTERLKQVSLEMHMANPPAFFLSQLPSQEIISALDKKARISFSASSNVKHEDDQDVVTFRIKDTGKVLSSIGLTNDTEKEELNRIIQVMNEETTVYSYYTPDEFYFVSTQGDILKILNILAQGVDPNKKFPDHDNETALHAAAAAGYTTIVHLLIQAGAVNDTFNDKSYTPLMLAVENGHKDVVFYLINNGALPDFKGDNGMNSIHLAAKSGSLEIVKTLLTARDIDVNGQDDGGWTPIVWASEHDHYDVVRHLLRKGANPNIKDNEGNTGLHWSAFSGSVDICFLYLDYGCDINAINERGDTPLHIAARQDSLSCVTLLLSRNADVMVKNKADQLAAECVIDKNSDTYLSLSLNLLLKKIASKYKHKVEKILHRDISRGKEAVAIQCVNDVDDEPPPTDFMYVTENCETTPMNIDRTITSLQYCSCDDDCSTSNCTCASISYQCWYDKDGLLLPNFNMLDPPMLFECNRACSCWSLNCRNRVLQHGVLCRLQLIRTKGKGWGVRTLKDIAKGTFICEYVGEMISDSAADKRADDSYLFDLDNKDGETYCLDARYYGNISRFINHLCEPNLIPVKIYVDHQDLNFPRIAFFASRDIKQYEELGFDYGEKFWVIKYKYFTCDCSSARCKYSKDTIQETLANYYKRIREEQLEEAAANAIQNGLPPPQVEEEDEEEVPIEPIP